MKMNLLAVVAIPLFFSGSFAVAEGVHAKALAGKSFAGTAYYPNGDQFNLGMSFTTDSGGHITMEGGYYSCADDFVVSKQTTWTQELKYTLSSGSAECSASGTIKISDQGAAIQAEMKLNFNNDTWAPANAMLHGASAVAPAAPVSDGATKTFEIALMDERARNQFIVESAVAYGADRQYMGESAMMQEQTGLNEFDYHRYLVELDGWILNGPTLWAPGSTVFAHVKAKGSLQEYDFGESAYYVCVPSKFAATDFNFERIAANLLISFPSGISSGNSSQPEGVNCTPSDEIYAIGKSIGVLKFALVRLPLDAETAEKVANSAARGIVDLNLSCIVGPGSVGSDVGWRRTNGADCTVVSGTATAGGQIIPLN